MANDLWKKDRVKWIISLFLQEIEQKKLNGNTLTDEERRWISNKSTLTDYVYSQNKHPVYTTDQTTEIGKEGANKYQHISELSIYAAISEMERDQIIERKDRQYQIKRTTDEKYKLHPILGIAPKLQVTHLPLDDIALFRVPERYACEIAHYLNTQFFCDDICCVALAGYILCFDIQLPPKSKFAKKSNSLVTRVKKALKDFDRNTIKNSESHSGITHVQLEAQQAKLQQDVLLEKRDFENLTVNSYGGTIRIPVKRKIKKATR